jgi:hypothetical protein
MRKHKRAPLKLAPASLFARRTVIVIPRWGVPIIGGAILFGLVKTPMLVNSIVCFVLSVTALIVTITARIQLRELRYAVHSALNDIENDDDSVPESVLEDDNHKIVLKRLKVNGKSSDRVKS